MRWLERLADLRPGRERVHSRPRVASAARAASQVRLAAAERAADGQATGASMRGLGSATAGAGVYVIAELGLVGIAPVAGAAHEESEGIARAAAAVARAAGRDPREVWQEALAEWLLARERAGAEEGVSPLPRAGRRARAWGEIDATLAALRGG